MSADILPIKITHHSPKYKLSGFLSINVSPGQYCNKMMLNTNMICSQCYSKRILKHYPLAEKAYRFNTDVLSKRILSSYECKQIEKHINGKRTLYGIRFNSIGELINDIHCENLQNIAYEIDPRIPITLWTKRPELLFSSIKTPLFKVVQSCLFLNRYILPRTCDDRIQHTFNVYDDREKMRTDIMEMLDNFPDENIAYCHGKCKECMLCYSNIDYNEKRYAIFELTKNKQISERKHEGNNGFN